jgi:hypothetical protein
MRTWCKAFEKPPTGRAFIAPSSAQPSASAKHTESYKILFAIGRDNLPDDGLPIAKDV